MTVYTYGCQDIARTTTGVERDLGQKRTASQKNIIYKNIIYMYI